MRGKFKMDKLLFSEKRKFHFLIIGLIIFSFLLIVSSLAIGYYKLDIKDVFIYLFRGKNNVNSNVAIIIGRIRIPRITAAFMIGAGLSISGAAYQGMFKNPLVSPDILGVSTGAGLGAAWALTLGLSNFMVQVYAFVFGIIVVSIAYFIGSRTKYGQDVSLVLAGSMLGALASSLIALLKYLADPNDKLPAITFWLMGSLSRVNTSSLIFSIVPIIIGGIIIYSLRWRLNILTLGDDEANAIGINPKKVRLITVSAATIISAASVCLGGIIGWVGLMIPHISRGIVGADYRRLIPVSGLIGGSFLLLMDDFARSLYVMEIPLGVLTAILGAPFFIMLIIRREK